MIEFIIHGNPVAQGRPRFARIGNHVRAYDPAKSRSWKESVRWAAVEGMNMKRHSLFTEALAVEITFWFQRPRGHYGTGKKAGFVKDSAPRHHTIKPDVENCVKGVLDGMKGIVYRDDSQVVMLIAKKRYTTDAPFTEVDVRAT